MTSDVLVFVTPAQYSSNDILGPKPEKKSKYSIFVDHLCVFFITILDTSQKTLQELRLLSSVTINCQVTKIVMNSGSQLSEL